ncbi:hypothetical protein [Vibrio parahaemolyticus]|uniref:hypothetical protein n=1 Tax=Vibrio parahaemolyticus TaxID=670 RepID=UPI001123858D|nr:hypothetical protein [Vibrio parahaemolyticus]EIO5099296.1 hypothetical protein [Vibrio parahaemolyticus]MDF4490063.1 hypothetical protein [Vibrio parahaemolyticus]MDG3384681.1 hypothetical protein [Vibrio parahaemolyticus]TOL28814.1 hypothetical protein CGI01_23825 [Vibrio parahaemolyticus]
MRDEIDPEIKLDVTKNLNVLRDWLTIVIRLASDHYFLLASVSASLFTLLCYLHANELFGDYGIEFLHVADLSDVYSVALSSGVVFSLVHQTMMLLLFGVFIMTFPSILRKLKKEGKIGKVITFMFGFLSLLIVVLLILLSNLSHEVNMTRPIEVQTSERLPRYRLITEQDQLGRGCVGIIASTSDNVVTWNYETSQFELIPKSKVVRMDFVLRAPIAYYPHTRPRGLSFSSREKDLEWALKNNLEWQKALKRKCGETVDITSMLQKELGRIKS